MTYQTIKFICEYNGKDFKGFQRQKNQRTVQGELEDALSKYFGIPIKTVGSGRTDSGVHARNQVCSFRYPLIDENQTFEQGVKNKTGQRTKNTAGGVKDLYKMCAAVNAFLPEDAAVRGFEFVDKSFHAQFDAKAKTYKYRCYISPHRSPLRAETHLQLYKQPDVAAMKTAAESLAGTHNFKAFSSEDTEKQDFVRTVYGIDISQSGDEITFTVRGNGFLRNMVRVIAGTLLDVGAGKISPLGFAEILEKKDRKLAGKTAPAHGLVLEKVEY